MNSKYLLKAKMILFKFALIIFTLLIFFGVGEIYLRIVGWGPTRMSQPDEILGYKGIPDYTAIYTESGKKYEVIYNNDGFRDINHSLFKPDGVFRIVILGDSMTAGVTQPYKDLYWKQLEKMLNDNLSDKTYEVISLGQEGYSTAQEYLSLLHYGIKYKPDLIILAFLLDNDIFENDISLNYRKSNYPYFSLTDNKQSLVEYPMLTQKIYPFYYNFKIIRVIVSRLRIFKERYLGKNITNESKKWEGYNIYSTYPNEDWQDAWKITELLLNQINDISKTNNAEFLLFNIIYRVYAYDDYWDNLKNKFLDLSDLDYSRQEPIDRLLAICEKNQLLCYNSIDDIIKLMAKDGIKRINPPDNIHWNYNGHSLTAEVLYNYIINNNLINYEIPK